MIMPIHTRVVSGIWAVMGSIMLPWDSKSSTFSAACVGDVVAPLLCEAFDLPCLADGDGHRVEELVLGERPNVDGDDGLVDVPMLPTHRGAECPFMVSQFIASARV